MLTTNHRQPNHTYSARLPWRRRVRYLAPYAGGSNILFTCPDHGGETWWGDSSAMFRGAVPAYLRRAYLAAGLPTGVVTPKLPLSPIEMLALLGPRLDHPVATYRVSSDLGSIPVDVFATDDPACREIHVDARYVAHALDQFEDCSFWRLDDSGIAVRDRHGFQIVGLIPCRSLPPADTHCTGGAV